jgi:hypothetical protein
MVKKIEIPSADFHVELVQGGMKAAMTETGAKSRDLLMVPVDQIKIVAGLNVRLHDDDYEEHVEAIKTSIIENGFYQHFPLSGYAGKESDQTFIYCTGGFTRLEAAKRAIAAGAPIEALPMVLKPSGTSMIDLTVALAMDNTGKPLKPYERAIVVKRLVGYGAEEADIATKMGISGQYVTDLLFMLGLPNTIQQMIIKDQVSAGHAVATARKHGADATKVLQAAIGPTPAAGTNGATPPTGRATPGTTGSGPKTTPKKVYISAIVYALALPDGLDWLKRWHGGEADAVAELAATMAKPKRAVAKPKAAKKAAGKGTGKGKGGRKSNAAKAAEAAAAAGAAAAAAAAVTGGAPADDDAPL